MKDTSRVLYYDGAFPIEKDTYYPNLECIMCCNDNDKRTFSVEYMDTVKCACPRLMYVVGVKRMCGYSENDFPGCDNNYDLYYICKANREKLISVAILRVCLQRNYRWIGKDIINKICGTVIDMCDWQSQEERRFYKRWKSQEIDLREKALEYSFKMKSDKDFVYVDHVDRIEWIKYKLEKIKRV
jgi:hypothetical protein